MRHVRVTTDSRAVIDALGTGTFEADLFSEPVNSWALVFLHVNGTVNSIVTSPVQQSTKVGKVGLRDAKEAISAITRSGSEYLIEDYEGPCQLELFN